MTDLIERLRGHVETLRGVASGVYSDDIAEAVRALERASTEVSVLRDAARKALKEQDESDDHHSAACMNWAMLEHSQHQCGLCDLRDAVSGRHDD